MKRIGIILLLFPLIFFSQRGNPSHGLTVEEAGIVGSIANGALRVMVPVQSAQSTTASMKIQVMDLSGKSFGTGDRVFGIGAGQTREISVGVPLFQKLDQNPGFYILRYSVLSDGKRISGKRSLLPITYPYTVKVLGGEKFAPGQRAGLRVLVTKTASGIPLPNIRISGSLKSREKNYPLFEGETASNGSFPVEFTVPSLAAGSYDLIIRATSNLAQQEMNHPVRLEPIYRVYITTDKPIYQPGQKIYFRSLVLSAIQNAPASTHDFIWEIRDPRGNRLFRKELKTDRFGIAAGEFLLAEEVNPGTYKIRGTIRAGGAEQFSEKDVTISRYVLPKFKVELTTAKNYYLPGERVKGEVSARYFFGKAVDGEVRLTAAKFDIGFTDFWEKTLPLKDGKASFEFDLPARFAGTPLEQGNAFVELRAIVEDSASQEQEVTQKLTVTADPILVAAIPASLKFIEGVENRLLVVTQYPDGKPAITEVHFGKTFARTNESGVAVLQFVAHREMEKVVTVRDASGKTVSRKVEFDLSGQGLIITPSKGFYRVGESALLEIFSNVSKTVYVDFIKNNQTLKTEALDLESHRGEMTADLSADFIGSVLVNAYSISRDGEIYRDSRWIVVEPASDLKIHVKAEKASYRPGEKGKLRFHVTDRKGKGVAAALGVAVVDEAVFSVSELRPGLEKVYFLLEEELQKPRYEIHALSFAPLLQEEVVDPVRAEAALANADRDFDYDLKMDSYQSTAQVFVSQFSRQAWENYSDRMELISTAIQQYYNRYKKYPPAKNAITELVDKHFLSREKAEDFWGQPFQIRGKQPEAIPWDFELWSNGPDELPGTADDINLQQIRMKEERFGGILAGAPAPASPAPAVERLLEPSTADGAGTTTEPRVREYFPETLLFEPALITDGTGHAVLEVDLADSITDWRVTVTGSSENGLLGSTTGSVRVFQDFFVDLDLPVALTKGDEITIPVALYNYLDQIQNIKLELQQAEWFASLADSFQTLTIQPGEVTAATFRIRAEQIGKQKLTVKAYGTKLSDAVQREVIVEPNGRKVEDTVNGRLSADVTGTILIPPEAVEGSTRLLLKIYPGLFNQLLEGLDSILAMPFGCFEQTSSTTYPNVLALQYMKRTGKITPEIRMKAEGYINLGYQRLVTFEVRGGGFSWFGNPPAHKILTAYGLMEFQDMSRVYEVDRNLIDRTATWLASLQKGDGSWEPDQGGIAEGAINRYKTDLVRITSYIGWALARTGTQKEAVDRAAGFVTKNFAETKDPYGLAVAANFLLERNPRDPSAKGVLQKLFALRIEDAETIHWKQEEPTSVYAEGPAAQVETTAIAAVAFMKDAEYSAAVSKMLTFLIKQKDPRGTWYTTQSTIWALKAFIEALSDRREAADAVVDILVNGKPQKSITIHEGNADVVQMINISDAVVIGPNTVQLKMKGKAAALFAVIAQYAVPWKERGQEEPLDIQISYDKTTLDVDDTATAKVIVRNNLNKNAEMVIVDLGIPPGFRIHTGDLDDLVQKKTIEKYSLTGRQAILYFERIEAGTTIEFRYRLTAKFPIKASSVPVRVYEYYNPQREDIAAPVEMVVGTGKL